jgi:hypothetical protein
MGACLGIPEGDSSRRQSHSSAANLRDGERPSDEDLENGRFKVIELNGAASEATNIYDARNSLFSAYRTLYKQWDPHCTLRFTVAGA